MKNLMVTKGITHPHFSKMSLTFRYVKTHPAAIAPSKAHDDDSGFDMHLVAKVKEEKGVAWYTTGLAVQPPEGYYFEMVGRSSISKSGYMLANNIGIIDRGYTGDLLVALVKINPEATELELPCRLVQLIPRHLVLMQAEETTSLNVTERGDGGFGSSGP